MKGNIWLLPKKKSIQAFRREQLVFWMNVFSSQVAGPLEANDHFTTHLEPLHSLSLLPLCSYLTRQKNMSVKRKKNGWMEMIFWASLQLSGDLFHHLS